MPHQRDPVVSFSGNGSVPPLGTFNFVRTSGPTTVRDKALPGEFGLFQNYPNPFNPTTVVSCQLPVASDVKLVVYDVLGREVATLVDDVLPAGSYEKTFDARGLASGVYFYRLSGGFSS